MENERGVHLVPFAIAVLALKAGPATSVPVENCGLTVTRTAPQAATEVTALESSDDRIALYRLALAYAQGNVVAQDCKRSAGLLERAASAGLPAAQNALGEIYESGNVVPASAHDAARWYRAAYDQGDARGTYNLGRMVAEGRAYEYGAVSGAQGQSQVFSGAEALHSASGTNWLLVAEIWKRAVAKGDPVAAYALGKLYETGAQGVPVEMAEAIRLLRIAADAGVPDAKESLEALLRKR